MSKINVPCHFDDTSWDASINEYQTYGTYYKGNVSGRGSSIDLLYGTTENYNWIALPVLEVATTLAHFEDTFWNSEKLAPLIGIVDAITVSNALSYMEKNKHDLLDPPRNVRKKVLKK